MTAAAADVARVSSIITNGRTLSVTAHSAKDLEMLDGFLLSADAVTSSDPAAVAKGVKLELALRLFQEAGFTVAMITGADAMPGAPSLLDIVLRNVVVSQDTYGIPGPHVAFDLVESQQDVKTAVNKGSKGKLIYVDFDGEAPKVKQARHFHYAFPGESAGEGMDLSGQSAFIAELNNSNQELQAKGLTAKWGTQSVAALALGLGYLKTGRVVFNGWLRVADNDGNDNAAGGRELYSDDSGVRAGHVPSDVTFPDLRAAVALESQKKVNLGA